jgi:hypothetical protein
LTLVSGAFLFSGSIPVNASKTLAVSQTSSGATGRQRPEKTRECINFPLSNGSERLGEFPAALDLLSTANIHGDV